MRLTTILSLLIAISLSFADAGAERVFAEYNGMKFEADWDFFDNELGDYAQLTGFTDSQISGDLVIPDKVYFPKAGAEITVNKVNANVIKSLPNITSVTFPASMYALRASYAISDCEKLEVVNLGKNLNSVSTGNPFRNVPSLREINAPDENRYFITVDGAIYTKDKTSLRIMPPAARSVSFPKECTTIATSSFFQCHLLEHIIIPEHITTIENYAFSFCSSLQDFEFPETVTTLGGAMFQGCTSLQRVVMNSHFDSVTGDMFWNCQNLREVVIGKNVRGVYKGAFDGCGKLERLILLPETPPFFVGDNWFYEGIYSTCVLQVPPGTGDAYRNADVWKRFVHIVDPLDPVSDEGMTAEYFVDSDPGIGNAEKLDAVLGANRYAISLHDCSPGAHIFGVRAITANGVVSPTVTHPIYIADEQLYNDLEYFVDNDPGEGKAIRPDHHFAKIVYFNVGTANLSLGTHTMNVRVKGDNGKWSAVMTRPFIVVEKIADLDYVVEYFYDRDPGFGKGHQIAAAEGGNSFFLPLESYLASGAHLLGVRCRDKEGNWSITEVNPLFIMPVVELERVEYYVDKDPGEGFGNVVAVNDNGKASFAIRTNDLALGKHRLNLRGEDEGGAWHDLFSREFTVSGKVGVEEITWSAGLRLSISDDNLSVLPSGLSDGTVIEVFTLDGILINRTIWQNTDDILNINLGVKSKSCLVVRAVGPDGYYCVETIR